jgi:hypothetical protein
MDPDFRRTGVQVPQAQERRSGHRDNEPETRSLSRRVSLSFHAGVSARENHRRSLTMSSRSLSPSAQTK